MVVACAVPTIEAYGATPIEETGGICDKKTSKQRGNAILCF